MRIGTGMVWLMGLALALAGRAGAQDVPVCRISVENKSSHFQAKAASRFSELLRERCGGAMRVEFYDDARLFRDSDAVNALARDQVEIIFPGIWQFDRPVPDVAAFMLPSVYARPIQTMRALADGDFGTTLAGEIERVLGVAILGPWLDVGSAHIFSLTSTIRTVADVRGKRIRVAGGRGNQERIRALGGESMTIPWPDLPSYLDNRLIDGILSTYEAVDSAALDGHGLRSVFEDEEYYPFYVPMVRRDFWERLSPELKAVMIRTWMDVVGPAREESVRAHVEAKAHLVSRGLEVFVSSEKERRETRSLLLSSEAEMARRLNISSETLGLLRKELGAVEP